MWLTWGIIGLATSVSLVAVVFALEPTRERTGPFVALTFLGLGLALWLITTVT